MRSASLLLLFLAGCGFADAETVPPPAAAEKAPPPSGGMRVEVAALQPSAATLSMSLPGEIKGSRDARLAAALGGYVEAVPVKPGQRVAAGQVLARVDATIHAAGLRRAQAQLAFAESEAARLEALGDLGTAQQRDSAHLQVEVARAGVEQAEAQLARAVITAPFAGTVAETFVEPGEVAGPGTPIARLVKLDPVEIELSVSDRDVVALEQGQPVTIETAARGGLVQGRITHIAAAANASTRSFLVTVEAQNADGSLLPGMIARVAVRREVAEGRLVVPQDWVVTRLEGQGVFVDDGGVARWRPVTLGQVVRDQIVVTEGLEAGDRVVVTGHRELVDGDRLIVSREGSCCRDGRAIFTEG